MPYITMGQIMDDNDISSIRLTRGTKNRLNDERHGRESDEDLINRLLNELQEYRRRCG
jgi:hypothetical protein